MLEIVSRFAIAGKPTACEPYGNGHIHRTYLVNTDAGRRYILQHINSRVFPDTEALMRNIALVTGHLRAQGLDEQHVLTIVPTREGALYWRDEAGEAWRVYVFVEGGKCLERATEAEFRQCGAAFGRFQRQLGDFAADRLIPALPGLHDTPARYLALREAVEKDALGRAKNVRPEIEFALAREAGADALTAALAAGRLPLRVTHNDTKLNNVILDERTGEPLCVIDLDTVMPGAVAYDFGDSIRFGASTAAEDERDLARVRLSLPLFRAYARGFLAACGGMMGEAERASLCPGARMMTLECGVRFLTDYLQGDVYFAVHRPGHNLDRCRTQFALVADMERQWDALCGIVEDFAE